MKITHDFTFIWREDSIFHEDYQEIFQILKTNGTEKTEDCK